MWKAKCYDGKCEQTRYECPRCETYNLVLVSIDHVMQKANGKCIKCKSEGKINLSDIL